LLPFQDEEIKASPNRVPSQRLHQGGKVWTDFPQGAHAVEAQQKLVSYIALSNAIAYIFISSCFLLHYC